ncbi:adenine glycosylase [Flavobacterium akiainvivens]|uniref:Adenine DNA glycosylase n=1 Tax=Flavobacterium akiainvivens TaxID=1202724 RepID=A0A0M9VIH1_9FLAO|nr:A/G-specific adenine glycosylase [Flavobacterium akiainvivens]KOS06660.1 adenine glycosylase [Flavobacterium akiainvivens]SFQ70576.1 A/G-specific DNA-adenine glycosylase [Flavobacterium akiainvivens]
MDFSNLLIQWYLQNKRDLPWRKTTHPYPVWLSEIMLQQTRVAQGLPYFLRFIEAFPTVNDMANAPEEQVLKLWQGLGYYSRARNLHATAKQVAFEMGGNFPNSYAGLLKLKGVGDYTAAAIASISYGEAVPVVDGNVYRVLARVFGIEADISTPSTKKIFAELAASLMPVDRAADFNQAMMEFGALQCVPKSPDCGICIFNQDCVAFNTGRVARLPVKLKKQKVTDRFFNYIIIKDNNGHTKVTRRGEKGIWHGLYEFPLLETSISGSESEIKPQIRAFLGDNVSLQNVTLLNPEPVIHKLSHQKLHINFWEATVNEALPEMLDIEAIKKYPFPIVIHNFIEAHWD